MSAVTGAGRNSSPEAAVSIPLGLRQAHFQPEPAGETSCTEVFAPVGPPEDGGHDINPQTAFRNTVSAV